MKNIPIFLIVAIVSFMSSWSTAANENEEYERGSMKTWHEDASGKMMMMGKHGMSGRIESIDHQTGWIKVKTHEGDLVVHFPPATTKELKNGDVITVHLSFIKSEDMKDHQMMDDKMMK